MDLHDLKQLLQQHFSDGLVTIVGSGLSCAEGLPGMTELANHLCTSLANGLSADDAKRWAALGPIVASEGLEAALLKQPPSPSLEAAIVTRTADLVSKREREIITEVFQRKRVLRFTRLLRHLLKPDSGLPIVTTNYDRLIEIAAEDAGLGVDTMFVGNFAGTLNEVESRLSFCREVTLRRRQVQWRYRTRVNVFKPHGSLDWYHRDGRPVFYSGELPLPRLIITPGLNKFRNGYESPFDRHRERANSAIDRATRFLVVGYGFNDDHLETHLGPRIRDGVPTLLLAHSLSPNAVKLATQCANVIALQHAELKGRSGTSVFVNKSESHIEKLPLWDLDNFISEVLEP